MNAIVVNVRACSVDSLIIHLGNLTASTFDKSGHAIIVCRGLDVFKPKRIR